MTFAPNFGRILSPTFQPNSLEVAEGFLPTDIDGLIAWYDFSDADTLFTDAGVTKVENDGDAIYRVNDKSGNGYHANQATLSKRPLYKTGIQNGLSVGRADFGSGQFLTTETMYHGITTNDFVVFAIVNIAEVSLTGFSFYWGTRWYYLGMIGYKNTNWGVYANNNKPFGSALELNTPYLLETRRKSGTFSGTKNRTLESNTYNYTNSFVEGKFGLFNEYEGVYPTGMDMGELVFAKDVTDEEVLLIRDYLNNKWAIY